MSSDLHVSITQWLDGAKTGDDEAFDQLWQRYYARLVGLARKNMGGAPAVASDEEDVAVSALKSFYFRAKDGRFPKLNDRDDLWKLLMTITLRKAWREGRRAGKQAMPMDPYYLGVAIAEGEPSSETAAIVKDRISYLFRLLDDSVLESIASMKLEGLTNKEIALAVNRSVATVERKLKHIRLIWSDEID
jgi:DNA-directed RNA polymerase specialized sigma24 family protein